jgi:hypothetical protein
MFISESCFCDILSRLRWTLEALHATVDAKIEELPTAMRFRLS